MPNKIFCLVLNYQNYRDTEKCIQALLMSDIPTASKIIILDNSSTNDSVSYLNLKFPRIKIIRIQKNHGFASGNNVGIRYALSQKTSHVLIINPDVTVNKKFFKPLLADFRKNHRLGLIAPAIDHLQGRHRRFGLEGHLDPRRLMASHTNLPKLPKTSSLRLGDFVTFACVIIKAEVFLRTGLLDERYFMYLEDVDFCLMATKQGFKSAVDPTVVVDHRTSSSFKKPTDKLKISFISQLKFIFKWLAFPGNLIPLAYTFLFYPYLYLFWTFQSFRHQQTGEN